MEPSDTKPILAVTLGDVAGVGPEVILRAWRESAVHGVCRPLVIGNPEVVRRAAALVAESDGLDRPPEVVVVTSPNSARPTPDRVPCLPVGPDTLLAVRPATVDARAGQAAYDAIATAVHLARTGQVDGVTTAPISKAAIWKAGHHYPGHTELLAELCGVGEFAMMLYLPPSVSISHRGGLGVVHVTLHMALRNVFGALTVDNVLEKCRLADQVMRQLKGEAPEIGVCALNPHAGEDGLFGDEEIRVIGPAVARGREEGMALTGPLPADTIMPAARGGRFDAVVAMVHDQGHIALKMIGMHEAVNVTLGLPIVRTSVAHGTAWDLAWKGEAESSGMVHALRVAARLATLRRDPEPSLTRPPAGTTAADTGP